MSYRKFRFSIIFSNIDLISKIFSQNYYVYMSIFSHFAEEEAPKLLHFGEEVKNLSLKAENLRVNAVTMRGENPLSLMYRHSSEGKRIAIDESDEGIRLFHLRDKLKAESKTAPGIGRTTLFRGEGPRDIGYAGLQGEEAQQGLWFSTDKKMAEEYAGRYGSEGTLYAINLPAVKLEQARTHAAELGKVGGIYNTIHLLDKQDVSGAMPLDKYLERRIQQNTISANVRRNISESMEARAAGIESRIKKMSITGSKTLPIPRLPAMGSGHSSARYGLPRRSSSGL